jgi:hypothetical protein
LFFSDEEAKLVETILSGLKLVPPRQLTAAIKAGANRTAQNELDNADKLYWRQARDRIGNGAWAEHQGHGGTGTSESRLFVQEMPKSLENDVISMTYRIA